MQRVKELGVSLVELTGGEPLAQPLANPLMAKLVQHGYKVLLETGGSEPVNEVPEDVHVIMDLKCPDSGMSERNHWMNLEYLKPSDEIKFVLASRADFEWARDQCKRHSLTERFQVSFHLLLRSWKQSN